MATVALETPKSSVWWLHLLQGTAALILGLMLLTAPDVTLVGLVTFLGFYWLITGVLALVSMFVNHLPQNALAFSRNDDREHLRMVGVGGGYSIAPDRRD